MAGPIVIGFVTWLIGYLILGYLNSPYRDASGVRFQDSSGCEEATESLRRQQEFSQRLRDRIQRDTIFANVLMVSAVVMVGLGIILMLVGAASGNPALIAVGGAMVVAAAWAVQQAWYLIDRVKWDKVLLQESEQAEKDLEQAVEELCGSS